MKIIDIQIEYLKKLNGIKKAMEKGNDLKANCLRAKFVYQIDNDDVLLSDGRVVYIIPRDHYFLTMDEDVIGKRQINMRKLIPSDFDLEWNMIPADITENEEEYAGIKRLEICGGGYSRWINKQYLKYFDKDCSFGIFSDEDTYKYFVTVHESAGGVSKMVGAIMIINPARAESKEGE